MKNPLTHLPLGAWADWCPLSWTLAMFKSMDWDRVRQLRIQIFSIRLIRINYYLKRNSNKLGWAEPHSRFPLSFTLLWTFLGCLPLEFVFILRILKICFGHLSSSLKFEYDPISGWWEIPRLIFWGCLHLNDLYNIFWSSKL